MELKVFLVWLMMLGGVGVLAGVCWLWLFIDRKRPSKHYDERQKTAQGKAYGIGFWLGIIYYLVVYGLLEKEIWLEYASALVLGGLGIQLLSTAICLQMTGSGLPFTKKPNMVFAMYLLLGILWMYTTVNSVYMERVLTGTFTMPWSRLIISVMFFSLGVVHLMIWLKDLFDEES